MNYSFEALRTPRIYVKREERYGKFIPHPDISYLTSPRSFCRAKKDKIENTLLLIKLLGSVDYSTSSRTDPWILF
jgi:hypothetical protein